MRAHCTYNYPKGLWNPSALGPLFVVAGGSPRVVPDRQFPDVGSDPIYLEFQLEAKTFGTPMADPVYHAPDRPSPMLYPKGGGFAHAENFRNGSFRVVLDTLGREQPRRYWQVSRAVPDQPSAFHRLNDADPQALASRNTLLDLASAPIREEAKKLLDRLIRTGKLAAGVRDRMDPVKLLPHPDDHLAVATAFEHHFAFSGEYEYTLTLRRQNRTIDPVETSCSTRRPGTASGSRHGAGADAPRRQGIPCAVRARLQAAANTSRNGSVPGQAGTRARVGRGAGSGARANVPPTAFVLSYHWQHPGPDGPDDRRGGNRGRRGWWDRTNAGRQAPGSAMYVTGLHAGDSAKQGAVERSSQALAKRPGHVGRRLRRRSSHSASS